MVPIVSLSLLFAHQAPDMLISPSKWNNFPPDLHVASLFVIQVSAQMSLPQRCSPRSSKLLKCMQYHPQQSLLNSAILFSNCTSIYRNVSYLFSNLIYGL